MKTRKNFGYKEKDHIAYDYSGKRKIIAISEAFIKDNSSERKE